MTHSEFESLAPIATLVPAPVPVTDPVTDPVAVPATVADTIDHSYAFTNSFRPFGLQDYRVEVGLDERNRSKAGR